MSQANPEVLVKEIILYLLILIGAGYIGGKFKVITEDVNKGISKLIINITFPLLIFTNFALTELTPEFQRNAIWVLLLSYLSILFLAFWGKLSARLLKLDQNQSVIHQMHTIFGNVGYLGFPVIGSVYGIEGLVYASLYLLANDTMLWTYGIFLINKSNQKTFLNGLVHLVNPNTIGIFLGILFMLFSVKVPDLLMKPAKDLGHITIILSMVYIGGMLSFIKLGEVYKQIHVFVFSLNKLLIVPFIIVLLFMFFSNYFIFPFSPLVIKIITMQVAMPAMATVVILAGEFKSDVKQATENVLVSTIASLFSIPLIIWLLETYF